MTESKATAAKMQRTGSFGVLIVSILSASAVAQKAPTLDELSAKHLAAIGPASLRTAITNRVIEGQSVVESRKGEAAAAPSTAHLITQADKYRVSMPFPSAQYLSWDVAYNGAGSRVRSLTAEQSAIAPLFLDCSEVLKEGLLGGALSAAWPFLDLKSRQSHLGAVTPRTIDGRRMWRVDYGAGAFNARLYFDADTFQHVRTVYEGCMDFVVVEERFEDFSSSTGLTLPARWIVAYSIYRRSQNTPMTSTWTVTVQRMQHNSEIPPEVFTLGGPVPQLKPTSKSSAPSDVP